MTAVRMASTATAVHLALLPQDPSPAGGIFAGQQLLDEQSAELAGRIEAAFLAEAGWDAATWVLTLPPDHPLLGRPVCRAPGCQTTCHEKTGICLDCRRRLARPEHGQREVAAATAGTPLAWARRRDVHGRGMPPPVGESEAAAMP